MEYGIMLLWFVFALIILIQILRSFRQLHAESAKHDSFKRSILEGEKLTDYIDTVPAEPGEKGCVVVLSPSCPPCHLVLEEIIEHADYYPANLSLYVNETSSGETERFVDKYKDVIRLNRLNKEHFNKMKLTFTPAFISYDEQGVVSRVGVDYNNQKQ
ncbi:hypothetical protein [Sediminibacillus sp. JSM 1682029]|uniref:hypothetical protein n=1 Tax=Sediminibacillus sp. JSM 1682029 TaxID=3229857 RepID=UPI0035258FF3